MLAVAPHLLLALDFVVIAVSNCTGKRSSNSRFHQSICVPPVIIRLLLTLTSVKIVVKLYTGKVSNKHSLFNLIRSNIHQDHGKSPRQELLKLR